MKFKKEFLLDELAVLDDPVSEKIVAHGRWRVSYEIIWKHPDGRHFRATYSRGATESQDETPWEYDDEVECTEVEQQPVTRLEWVNKT